VPAADRRAEIDFAPKISLLKIGHPAAGGGDDERDGGV